MKKYLSIIVGIVLATGLGLFFYTKPVPPFGAVVKTNIELAEECIITKKINECFDTLDVEEKSQIKSVEISKLNHVGKFTAKDLEVEILSLQAIQVGEQHGVEIMARAWKGTKQLGFGKDGSVETERFRIFNPPILVPDPNGDIIQEWIEKSSIETVGVTKQRKLREDGVEAIRQTLAHTIGLVGKSDTQIVKGSVGNTTDTYYPTTDGYVAIRGQNTSFATLRGSNGTNFNTIDADVPSFLGSTYTSNQWSDLFRPIFIFDTSNIGTDLISSAIFSLYGETKQDADSNTPSTNIYPAITASDTALAAGDFQNNTSSIAWCDTAVTYAGFSSTGYNDFILNATGIAGINKTVANKTKIAWKDTKFDVGGATPVWGTNHQTGQWAFTADQTGTTSDPKLVVVHGGAAGGSNPRRMIIDGMNYKPEQPVTFNFA